MSRESIYKNYQPAIRPDDSIKDPGYWFIFKKYKMLVEEADNDISIPYGKSLEELKIKPVRTNYLGTLKGQPTYAAEVATETEAPKKMTFMDLRRLYDFLDEDIYLLAGKALQINLWDRNHQFCGRCGTPTENSKRDMAKVCSQCGFRSYARLSPAVITAIIKDGEILMARHGYRGGMYGLIAGFVEPGETLEEAVEREIMEEVGLKVKNVKLFGNQPWPFPHSLMVGFTAAYESGEIKVDGREITSAKWFTPEELPRIPSKVSIASELIDWFIEKNSKS